jgi:hypothetical protein
MVGFSGGAAQPDLYSLLHQPSDELPVGIPRLNMTISILAFVAPIDDPSRIRRSRDIGAYLGLVPGRYQSDEVDYVGGIEPAQPRPDVRRR